MTRSTIKLSRDRGRVKNPKLIFVATEGEETEGLYLEIFEQNTKIVIVPIPSHSGKCSPGQVISNLNEFILNKGPAEEPNKYQILEGRDEFWLMIDTDHWINPPGHIRNYQTVVQEAIQKGYNLAISRSSIEVWLYLHFFDLKPEDEGQPSNYFEAKLKQILSASYGSSYSKSYIDKRVFEPRVKDAVNRCKAIFQNDSNRWPQVTGSYVYRLIESIENF